VNYIKEKKKRRRIKDKIRKCIYQTSLNLFEPFVSGLQSEMTTKNVH